MPGGRENFRGERIRSFTKSSHPPKGAIVKMVKRLNFKSRGGRNYTTGNYGKGMVENWNFWGKPAVEN